jgi:ADP-heptose:LPS heptosyltransferase
VKILVIRLSSIGDIVLTTPVIRCLKEQLKQAEIHVLTKPHYRSILDTNPHVAKCLSYENDSIKTIQRLKAENYDYIIDLHKNVRSLRIRKALNKKAFDFPKLNIRKWLAVNFKLNTLTDLHVVDRYFEAVAALGVKNDGKGLDFFIPEKDVINPIEIFGTNDYFAVAMGAQYATKIIPVEKLIEILTKTDGTIVLLGGQEDQTRSKHIVTAMGDRNVIDMCGKLCLNQSADVVKKARVILTNDTGLMHIASAFDTPIVSVWGNTIPALGMYPYRPYRPESYTIHQVQDLSCRPCSKIGFQACPKKHFKCMTMQDATAIANDLMKSS